MVKKLREKLDQLRKTIWKSSGKKKESKKGEEAQKVENRKEVDTGKEGAQSEITHSFFFSFTPPAEFYPIPDHSYLSDFPYLMATYSLVHHDIQINEHQRLW